MFPFSHIKKVNAGVVLIQDSFRDIKLIRQPIGFIYGFLEVVLFGLFQQAIV